MLQRTPTWCCNAHQRDATMHCNAHQRDAATHAHVMPQRTPTWCRNARQRDAATHTNVMPQRTPTWCRNAHQRDAATHTNVMPQRTPTWCYNAHQRDATQLAVAITTQCYSVHNILIAFHFNINYAQCPSIGKIFSASFLHCLANTTSPSQCILCSSRLACHNCMSLINPLPLGQLTCMAYAIPLGRKVTPHKAHTNIR